LAELLAEVGLTEAADLLPRQLSGGMAQRVALARALAGEPEVLLLDEPFSALDAFNRMRLQDLVLKIWQDYRPTMLMVTHDIEEALYLSDRVVVLGEKPAGVREIIEVKLPRPRNRSDAHLVKLRSQLLTELV
jgi:sulfonate transport system ATP-binding protein